MEKRQASRYHRFGGLLRRAGFDLRGLLGCILVCGLIAGPAIASSGSKPSATWDVLHSFEQDALRDYEFHVISDDVLQRGQILLKLSQSELFDGPRRDCGRAAQTLSFMLVGYYQSSKKRQVAADWHYFSSDYLSHRKACLAALKLQPQAYPLPRWFGR